MLLNKLNNYSVHMPKSKQAMIKQCNQQLHHYSLKMTSGSLADCLVAYLPKLMSKTRKPWLNNVTSRWQNRRNKAERWIHLIVHPSLGLSNFHCPLHQKHHKTIQARILFLQTFTHSRK